MLTMGGVGTPATMNAGFWVGDSRILCACVVQNTVWLGTDSGGLFEYNINDPTEQPRRTFLKGKVPSNS